MSSIDLLKEANRVMVICNSCRYCEGFCAVFPAMELRRTFTDGDLKYLANLCHNCRDCFYACQYAPPHEFDLNVPRSLGNLRLETYREFAWPNFFKGLFQRNGLTLLLISVVSIIAVLLLAIVYNGYSVIFSAHIGENAFYEIIPYRLIVFPFSAIALLVLAVLLMEVKKFWKETGGTLAELVNPRAHARAIWDVLRLKYLDGGSHGCNYPDERFSHTRRWFHHQVFYGFMLCLISTSVAAFYDHFLYRAAPYPFWSWPVVLGTVGGLSLILGTGGLLYLKQKMDPQPAAAQSFGMDLGFLVLLFVTTLTGFLLLILRQTPAMGVLLAIHLGVVVALFVTLPYGKFIHAAYRYAALIRNAIEQARN